VFIRAVKRHGLVSRMDAIAAEVGRSVERAPPAARLGLWYGMLAGCDRAISEAIRMGKDIKVCSGPGLLRAAAVRSTQRTSA